MVALGRLLSPATQELLSRSNPATARTPGRVDRARGRGYSPPAPRAEWWGTAPGRAPSGRARTITASRASPVLLATAVALCLTGCRTLPDGRSVGLSAAGPIAVSGFQPLPTTLAPEPPGSQFATP
jgi:hypothetical protein